MRAYFLSTPLILRNASQTAIRLGAGDVSAPTTAEVFIAAQREIELLHKALIEAGNAESAAALHLVDPAALLTIPGMPARLGVGAYAEPQDAPVDCLLQQLAAMRETQPHRQHFRILLLGGFGSNLGDNLLGLAAFRHVHAALAHALPALSVDVLLGWHSDDRLERLFRDVPGVDRIHTQGLSLEQFSCYAGWFDTSQLITQARYGSMPMVDWYLWWMGLDPARIAPECKRNAVAIPAADLEAVAAALVAIPRPRILINPKSSVSLRTLPAQRLPGLLRECLDYCPKASFILLQDSPICDARIFNLAQTISQVDRLAALMSEVDGLIGVDTYTAHLANATATPAVTVYTSFSPEIYPYYPLTRDILLPGAESLPGWGRPKLPEPEWQLTAEAYAAAWEALPAARLLEALQDAMACKAAITPQTQPTVLPPLQRCSLPLKTLTTPAGSRIDQPNRQRPDTRADLLDQTLRGIAEQVLKLGDTVIHIGPGVGSAAIDLARRVGHQGRLIAIEPRRQLFQLLMANLKHNDIWHAEAHQIMPEGETPTWRKINGLQCADDYQPLTMHNSAPAEDVMCWPLDTLPLNACSLLILNSPLASISILTGALATVKRYHPVILIGIIATSDIETYTPILSPLNYQLRALTIKATKHCILIAEPRIPSGSGLAK